MFLATSSSVTSDFLLPRLAAPGSLPDGGSDGVTTLGSRDDALGTCEECSSLEGLQLLYIHSLHESVLQQLADDDTGAMITKSTSMDVRGHEIVAEGEHRQQGCVACLVTEVILEDTTCKLGAGSGFGSHEARGAPLQDVVAHEWERNAAEV